MASDRFSKHCTPACSLSPSLSLCLSLSLSLSRSLALSLSLSLSFSVFLLPGLRGLSLSLSLAFSRSLSVSLSLSFSPLVPLVYGFHCPYITYIDVTPLVCICSPDSCFPGSWALSCSAIDESPRPGLQDRKGIAPEKMSWLASTSILILRRSTPRAFAPCAARMARPPLECCTMSLWLRSSTHSCLAHLQRPLQTVFSCCNQRLQDGTDALLLGALLLDATFSVQMSPA